MVKNVVAAGAFKARCLQIMDDVQRRRTEVTITKRGIPVAKLVPVEREPTDVFDCMAGSARIDGDIVGPVGEPDDWEVLG